MILVDSSVWIDHLRRGDARLAELLSAGQVLPHPFVIGELALLPLLDHFPGRILLDHCGRPDIATGLHAPAFQAVLFLGRTGSAWVKLSGYAKFSRYPWPHPDV